LENKSHYKIGKSIKLFFVLLSNIKLFYSLRFENYLEFLEFGKLFKNLTNGYEWHE